MEKRPPAKRQTQDPQNGSSKRFKNQPAPLSVPLGSVSFRRCNSSRIGGVIGKSGSSIKHLQQSTSAKIRVEDALPDSTDRVITIIASGSVRPVRLSLSISSRGNEVVVGDGEVVVGDGDGEVEVSAAQEALIKVFERILEVAMEENGAGLTKESVVSVRLLADRNQAGSVIGKGGKVVKKIRDECGCTIKVLSAESLPCAAPNDEVIEIEGCVLDVKKGLVAVTRKLQDNQPVENLKVTKCRDLEAASLSRKSLIDRKADIAHRVVISPLSNSFRSYSSERYPLSLEAGRVPSFDNKTTVEEVQFRILCSNDRVGGIIGKGGDIIKALTVETGASISIGASVPDCDERLISITAAENKDSRFSPTQNAVIQVFNRSVEAGMEKGLDKGFDESAIITRLVVQSNQIGCLLGKGGSIIAEIRKSTGAGISILSTKQVPKCALEDDRIVEISGEFSNVQDALCHVTGRLRERLLSIKTVNDAGGMGTSSVPDISPYHEVRDSLSFGAPSPVEIPYLHNRSTALAYDLDRHDPGTKMELQISHHHNRNSGQTHDVERYVTGSRMDYDIYHLQNRNTGLTHDRDRHAAGNRLDLDISHLQNRSTGLTHDRDRHAGGNRLDLNISHLRNRSTGLTHDRDRHAAGNRLDLDISHLRNRSTGLTHDRDRHAAGNRMDFDISHLRNRNTAPTHDLDRHDAGNRMDSYFLSDISPYQERRDPISFGVHETIDVPRLHHRNRNLSRHGLDQHNAGDGRVSSIVNDLSPYHEVRDHMSIGAHASFHGSHLHNRSTGLTHTLDHFEQTYNMDQPISLKLREPQKITGLNSRSVTEAGRGLTSSRAGLELGSGSRTALVTNTTVEIVVPDDVIGSVYGENGSKLTRLRQISGAKVTILDPHPGTRDRIVVISGTPDETQAAQSLIHAFILTGSSGID